MQAVILAAGQGRRLLPLTREIPKSLLPVSSGGDTILELQVGILESLGVDEIIVVVGHGKDRVFSTLGPRVAYVENPDYLSTNSIYSFWLASDMVGEDTLILNGDVLFHPDVVGMLLDSSHEAVLSVDTGAELDDESMKVRLEGERVAEISKRIDPRVAQGENLGIVRFRGDGLLMLKQTVSRMVESGDVNRWIPAAFQGMLEVHPVYAVDVRGLPWIEIDFVEDLEKARNHIFSKIAGELRL